MSDKRILNALAFIAFFAVIGLAVFNAFKKADKPKEEYIFNEPAQQEKQKETEQKPEETTKDYIILTRTTYSGSYRTTLRVHSTGVLEQSTVKEDTVVNPNQQEKYINVGELTDYELTTIKETVSKMANEEKKQTDLSNGYGIEVRLTSRDKILYSAEYFSQENVNRLHQILNKY